jgi:aldehyde dehydrogenase (NAD+)
VLEPANIKVQFDPLGVGLIIGTWNYPLMLTLSPLIAAIAGGNVAVLKPSEVAPASADAIARLVPDYLDRDAFSVVLGAVPETTALLEQQWDHIFFTGGTPVAKVVMTAAAKKLTPVVLELGGKSPTIVHSSADLRVAARRIAQGRWDNAGQTCTAPDYVLVLKDVAKHFLEQLKESILHFYGDDPQKSPDYGRIVTTRHFDRLTALLASGTVYHGGRHDRADKYIEPTVLVNVPPDSPAMQEEIFGPILPVLEVYNVEQAIDFVNARPSPLGLYIFAEDERVVEQILGSTSSGDAGVNECTIQPLVPEPALRRRRQLRDGQIPRRVGFPHLHERPRNAVPWHVDRPRPAVPALPRSGGAARGGRFIIGFDAIRRASPRPISVSRDP